MPDAANIDPAVFTGRVRRDYAAYRSKGVVFVRGPTEESYGTVAVFADLYGTLWDLLQPKSTIS